MDHTIPFEYTPLHRHLTRDLMILSLQTFNPAAYRDYFSGQELHYFTRHHPGQEVVVADDPAEWSDSELRILHERNRITMEKYLPSGAFNFLCQITSDLLESQPREGKVLQFRTG